MNKFGIATLAVFGILTMFQSTQAAEARGFRGGASTYAAQGQPMFNRSWTGPHGSTANVNGNGAYVPNVGGYYNGNASAVGARGGTVNAQGSGSYKNGYGGSASNTWNASGPNGGKSNGYDNGAYNAQTGAGNVNSGANYTNGSGQQYGYSQQSNFVKGQGGSSTVNTDNHGQYDVNWGGGQKPVVTPVSGQ